jgi:hypothetical protein
MRPGVGSHPHHATIKRIGNPVLSATGSAFIAPEGAVGRMLDTIPSVIPGNPYGMFGESGFGNPSFGD